MRSLLSLVVCLATGCSPDPVTKPSLPTLEQDESADAAVVDSSETVLEGVDPCLTPTPIPLAYSTLNGFSSAEDFDFDGEGRLVSVDWNANLFGQDLAGDTTLISPNVAVAAAGTRILPSGDWAVCDAASGSLVLVDGITGAKRTLLSGLNYPNGLEVDLDGFLYVAEQNSGTVRRIDSVTGDFDVIASSLNNPNGLAFSPDYETLYVGSFGDGTVMAIRRKPGMDEWEPPTLLTSVDEVVAPVIQPCVGSRVGDACYRVKGGVGVCDDSRGFFECVAFHDEAACLGKKEGDSCRTVAGSRVFDSACFSPGGTRALYCPRVDRESWQACVGGIGSSCSVGGDPGACILAFDGVPVCSTDQDEKLMLEACESHDRGDLCTAEVAAGVYQSWCMDLDAWGRAGVGCKPPMWKMNAAGGLDGINTDACNNVYVSEFVTGHIYRIHPSGLTHRAVSLPSSWVPNMRWSHGFGGWDADRLYVSDRGKGRIFSIDVGQAPRSLPFIPPVASP